MNQRKPAIIHNLQERFSKINIGRGLYTAFILPSMMPLLVPHAFAADTIWTKASAIMQDVYSQILGISTIAAVVTAAVALLLMNFSRSGRTVDESRAWLGVLIYTAPIAFATGASESTGNVFSSWCRMLGGQLFLLIMNAWCLRLFTSMVGTFLSNPLSI